jgi:Protein of unknown function (DUF1217)
MVSSIGSPIVDYKVATSDQSQLLAQFQKSPQYAQDVANFRAGIGKVTSVDTLLGNYNVLKFVLSAYDMSDAIDEKGLLKQLLSEDPSQSTSLAQQLGSQKYTRFAQDLWSLSSDDGLSIGNPLNINKLVSRYTQVQFNQWLASADNDPALATALDAKASFQDAVEISQAGALYATFQQAPDTQAMAAYIQKAIANVKSPADLLSDAKLLDAALTAYGVDPASLTGDTAQKLLTQDPNAADSVAALNPGYQAFAYAFRSLQTDGGDAIGTSSAVTSLVNRYTQAAFVSALTSNSDAQNAALFGAGPAANIAAILSDAKTQAGLNIGASYYTAQIGKASSAEAFLGDAQLSSVALSAYGIDPTTTSITTLQSLLTQDPNAADSVAQLQPEYAAFAQAFSYSPNAAGGARTSGAAITGVADAFETQQLKSILNADIALSGAQSARNTQDGEAASAPLNLYQILGDSSMASVVFGAYSIPAAAGGYDPQQQIDIVERAGFTAQSLSQPGALDKLMQRYLANSAAQSAPSNPALTLLQSTGAYGGPITLDLSFLAPASASAASGPNGYLLDLFA